MNDFISCEDNRVVLKDDHATLFDMGDAVACLRMHSPANAISESMRLTIEAAIEEVEKNYQGLVVSSNGPNFCVGGNLKYLLQIAQAGDWDTAEKESKKLHDTFMGVKYCKRPVVAAPFANTLGGGVEMCLHCSRIQAIENIKMGLVEFKVGLIPGAGGVKEMTVRSMGSDDPDSIQNLEKAFINLVQGKIFMNAQECIENGYISANDKISSTPEILLSDAKNRVLELYAAGYSKPINAQIKAIGESGMSAIIGKCEDMNKADIITDYDLYIAKKMAYVMQGGLLQPGAELDEEYLLSLERELFVSLLGEQKTQERMEHLLKTGKPLRN